MTDAELVTFAAGALFVVWDRWLRRIRIREYQYDSVYEYECVWEVTTDANGAEVGRRLVSETRGRLVSKRIVGVRDVYPFDPRTWAAWWAR